jgi:GxxExxY protein
LGVPLKLGLKLQLVPSLIFIWNTLFINVIFIREPSAVDTKVIDGITDHERGQMLNYLRITRLPVGVSLNFRYAKLEWERLVNTSEHDT